MTTHTPPRRHGVGAAHTRLYLDLNFKPNIKEFWSGILDGLRAPAELLSPASPWRARGGAPARTAGEGTGCPFPWKALRPEGHVLVAKAPVPQSTEGLE